MKLYWFRNLVHYFPSWDIWNMTRHIFWRHWRMTSKVRKQTSRDTKNENKRRKFILQLDVVFKKKRLNRNISVIQLSDRVYNVTFPAYDIYSLRLRNVTLYTLSDSWITYNIALFHERQSSPRVIKTTIQGTKARDNYIQSYFDLIYHMDV